MRVVCCLLILAISVIDCAADDGVRDEKILEALSKDDSAAVASYFHYPPDQKKAEAEQDRRGVSTLLGAILAITGPTTNPVASTDSEPSLDITVGGGDLNYWEKHPQFVRRTYTVEYKIYGSGLVKIDWATIDGKPALRQIVFALSARRADAQQRMKELMEKLAPTIKQLTDPPNEKSI